MLIPLLLIQICAGTFFILEGKSAIQCFIQKTTHGKELSGAYVISGEKDQNVVTTLLDNHGRILYSSQPKTREGKFEFPVEKDSTYKLCFQSKDKTPKTISFEFYVQEGLQEEKIATQEEIGPLRSSFRKLSRNLDTVYRNIQFYERREKTHRDLAELTCDRILFGAIIKMIVLAFISLAQIYMLRGFFNNKKGITI